MIVLVPREPKKKHICFEGGTQVRDPNQHYAGTMARCTICDRWNYVAAGQTADLQVVHVWKRVSWLDYSRWWQIWRGDTKKVY